MRSRTRSPSGTSRQSRLTASRTVPSGVSIRPGGADADAEDRPGRRADAGARRGRRPARGPPGRRGPRPARENDSTISPRRSTIAPRKTFSPRSRPTRWRASSVTSSRIGALPPVDGPRPISLGEAVAEEGRDEVRHGRPGQAGRAGDLGPADRPAVVDRAQDEALVVGARLLVGGLPGPIGEDPAHGRQRARLRRSFRLCSTSGQSDGTTLCQDSLHSRIVGAAPFVPDTTGVGPRTARPGPASGRRSRSPTRCGRAAGRRQMARRILHHRGW